MNYSKDLIVFLLAALILLSSPFANSQTIDELYKSALKEGGSLNFYSALAQVNASKILPSFEKQFPGIKVNHIDATGEKLVVRAINESRGGRTIADVLQVNVRYLESAYKQGLLADIIPSEASPYSDTFKGSFWVASDLVIIVPAWNSSLVRVQDEPKSFEDFGDPKWKNRLIAEPRAGELLVALAKHKYNNDQLAISLLRKIAANNVEFHSGYAELAQLMTAGQGAVCVTCYSHHFPPLIKKSAPVKYMLTEGVAIINGNSITKNAPHPNTGLLWSRWVASEEGQKVYAIGGRTPAHSRVEPVEKTRPQRIYPFTIDDLKDYPKYETIWKETFRLR